MERAHNPRCAGQKRFAFPLDGETVGGGVSWEMANEAQVFRLAHLSLTCGVSVTNGRRDRG